MACSLPIQQFMRFNIDSESFDILVQEEQCFEKIKVLPCNGKRQDEISSSIDPEGNDFFESSDEDSDEITGKESPEKACDVLVSQSMEGNRNLNVVEYQGKILLVL
jgi:hypothetical protein